MLKAFIGKLASGVVLSVGLFACGAGSEEASEEFALSDEAELEAESSGGEISAESSQSATGEAGDGTETSAEVEASGLVCTQSCFISLAQCFPVRDQIFEETGVLCICQNPDLDQCCGSGLVDLECNL